MLLCLTIRDFVIVDHLELEFGAGFGALTGETGAGKSILVDALTLALGGRADAGMIRDGREKTEVTAVFDLARVPEAAAWLDAQEITREENMLVLRRIVDRNGRSRATINGSAATLQQLREAGGFLVEIHGQHAHQSLLRADAQRERLDTHGGLVGLARAVTTAWKNWRHLERQLETIRTESAASARARETLAWQVDELESLGFSATEWQELEAEQRRLAHAAGLIEDARFVLDALSGGEHACETRIAQATGRVRGMAEIDTALAAAAGMLQSVEAELGEAISHLRRYADRLELDPARLEEVDRRMHAVLSLARKYRAEPEELPALLASWQTELAALQEAADAEALRQKAGAAQARYLQLARELSDGRKRAAQELGKEVSAQMQALALSNGRFEAALIPVEGGSAHGLEQVEFRVAGLAAQEARALARVASGGELSRISLALQAVTARNASVPTLIFDEVDVGIGGGVAEIVGHLLAQLGTERQVLCVTHLPQVAACATWHWRVRKSSGAGPITSHIDILDAAVRVEEIARMLGGVEITETTRRHAREMLGR
ncbi:MAG: DNA repair protein RecN [Zoogloeaceae bacterium]|jgi:DNA repair protein RecN (Recombination protein N)|nr:DNA repair protein RecN [Zoogloeaceae bacterium]